MFNKKKRHFNNQHRPHYTRQPGGPDHPDESKPSTQEGQNAVETGSPVNAAPVASQQQPQVRTDVTDIPVEATSYNIPVQSAEPVAPPAASPVIQGAPQPQPSAQQNPAQPGQDVSTCPICNMPIRSVNTAVHQKDTGSLVHFDCALRELSKEYYPKLGRFKKIYYIGAGNFAVVKEFYDKRGHLKNYEILEKIPYEPKEK